MQKSLRDVQARGAGSKCDSPEGMHLVLRPIILLIVFREPRQRDGSSGKTSHVIRNFLMYSIGTYRNTDCCDRNRAFVELHWLVGELAWISQTSKCPRSHTSIAALHASRIWGGGGCIPIKPGRAGDVLAHEGNCDVAANRAIFIFIFKEDAPTIFRLGLFDHIIIVACAR